MNLLKKDQCLELSNIFVAAKEIIQTIANVLDDLSKVGLVHRDLHSNNILLQRDTQGELRATLLDIDFLANTDGTNVDRHTYQGNRLTISPEGAVHSISASSDIFSLAVLSMITFLGKKIRNIVGVATTEELQSGVIGRFLALSTSPPEVQSALINAIDEFPEELRAEIHGLIIFLIHALHPSPNRRPHTAEQIRELLYSTPNTTQV